MWPPTKTRWASFWGGANRSLTEIVSKSTDCRMQCLDGLAFCSLLASLLDRYFLFFLAL